MKYNEIIRKLKSMKNQCNIDGMAHYGIKSEKYEIYGVKMGEIKSLAGEIKKDIRDKNDRHELAEKLWQSKIFDAMLLAGFVEVPELVTKKQMDKWVKDFDNWALCDSTLGRALDKNVWTYDKAVEYSKSDKEFIKRAGFALMAWLPVHDKKADDKKFEPFLDQILKEAEDERNFVKKAINWALRNIGKKNIYLNKKAIVAAENILKKYPEYKSANWIAKDALRELKSEKVQKRFK